MPLLLTLYGLARVPVISIVSRLVQLRDSTGKQLHSRATVRAVRHFDSKDSFTVAVIRLADDARPPNLLCNLLDVIQVLTNEQMNDRLVSRAARYACLSVYLSVTRRYQFLDTKSGVCGEMFREKSELKTWLNAWSSMLANVCARAILVTRALVIRHR